MGLTTAAWLAARKNSKSETWRGVEKGNIVSSNTTWREMMMRLVEIEAAIALMGGGVAQKHTTVERGTSLCVAVPERLW